MDGRTFVNVQLHVLLSVLAMMRIALTLELTLNPSTVPPAGKMLVNCSLPGGLSDNKIVLIKDQNDETVWMYTSTGPQVVKFKDRISKVQSPDGDKQWASFELAVPYCYSFNQLKCQLIDMENSLDETTTADFKIQHIAPPNIYRNTECITCGDGTKGVYKHTFKSFNDTTLHCRLDGVTEVSKVTWSEGYDLVKGTNLTNKDAERCMYNHTSTAEAKQDKPLGSTVHVVCTAQTSSGLTLRSPELQVTIGTNNNGNLSELTQGKNTTTIIIVAAVIVVLLIGAAIAVAIVMKKRKGPQGRQPVPQQETQKV